MEENEWNQQGLQWRGQCTVFPSMLWRCWSVIVPHKSYATHHQDSLLEQMEELRKPLENGHTKNGAATLLLAAYWAWTECSSPSRANEPIQYEVYYKFLTNVCESVGLMWPQISTQYFDSVRWTAGTAHGLLKPFCHNSSAVTLIFKKLQKHVHACTWCIVQKNQYHRRNQPWQYTYIITHTHTHTHTPWVQRYLRPMQQQQLVESQQTCLECCCRSTPCCWRPTLRTSSTLYTPASASATKTHTRTPSTVNM